jgi:hypothetical protein
MALTTNQLAQPATIAEKIIALDYLANLPLRDTYGIYLNFWNEKNEDAIAAAKIKVAENKIQLELDIIDFIENAPIEEVRATFKRSRSTTISRVIGFATFEDYFEGSYGIFEEVDRIPRNSIFMHSSGDAPEFRTIKKAERFLNSKRERLPSQYYREGEYLYRIADHWGSGIRTCDWILNGEQERCDRDNSIRIGRIWIGDLFRREVKSYIDKRGFLRKYIAN